MAKIKLFSFDFLKKQGDPEEALSREISQMIAEQDSDKVVEDPLKKSDETEGLSDQPAEDSNPQE